MANAYVTVDVLKGTGVLNATGTVYDPALLRLAEGVSREIDRYLNRHLYYVVETRTFDGDGTDELLVTDLISIAGSGLKEDTNYDGTYETVWAATDYLLRPSNANPTSTLGLARPYTSILVNPASNGTQDAFLHGDAFYQIAGTWGYCLNKQNTGETGSSGTLTSTGTSLVLTASTTLEKGMTLVIENEVVYITGTGSGGTSVTITRAVNGSTATAHDFSTAITINKLVFPEPIVEAAIIQASRLWKRRDSGYASQIGMPETGQFVVWKGGLDDDVKMLLNPYRRLH